MIMAYKKSGIKLIAFGFGDYIGKALDIARNLKRLGLDRSFAISDLRKLPEKLVTTLLNEMS